ncbi:hypothetical protein D3C81_2152250 [compost metagenome]
MKIRLSAVDVLLIERFKRHPILGDGLVRPETVSGRQELVADGWFERDATLGKFGDEQPGCRLEQIFRGHD